MCRWAGSWAVLAAVFALAWRSFDGATTGSSSPPDLYDRLDSGGIAAVPVSTSRTLRASDSAVNGF